MEGQGAIDIGSFLFHYFVQWHPVYYLYTMGAQYDPDNVETGVWLALAVLGIAVWFGLTRVAAEVPGRSHGNMIVWWIIFSVLHIWSLPIYIIYEIVSMQTRRHFQDRMQTKYADRTASEIRSNAKDKKYKHLPDEFR